MNDSELILAKLSQLLGEPKSKITLTSVELACQLGVSQQTSSRYLIRLEKEGFISRANRGRKQEVQLTEKGISVLSNLSKTLTSFLRRKHEAVIRGSVVSGLGEGAYYVKQYGKRIAEALGFQPYLGTLNVRVEGERPDLSAYASKRIEGFSHGGRHFGWLDLVPAELEVKGHKVDCFIAVPERTHHKSDLELVSRINLRDKYNLRDRDKTMLVLKSG